MKRADLIPGCVYRAQIDRDKIRIIVSCCTRGTYIIDNDGYVHMGLFFERADLMNREVLWKP